MAKEKKEMRYDPAIEVLVFETVEALGEGTRPEILDYMKNTLVVESLAHKEFLKEGMTPQLLLRYLGRWKAKKIITVSSRAGEEIWRLSDVPPWYRQKVAAVLQLQKEGDMKAELKALHDRWKASGHTVSQPVRKWGNYKEVSLVFETIDPILGGRPKQGIDGKLFWPRNPDNNVFVPMSWWYGWTRDNIAMIGDSGTQYHIGYGHGKVILEEGTKMEEVTLPAKVGFTTYETLPPGVRIETVWRYPFRGSSVTEADKLKAYLELLGETPVRGLGANPRAFGGRVKLVEFQVQE
jgi:hypothetical protein